MNRDGGVQTFVFKRNNPKLENRESRIEDTSENSLNGKKQQGFSWLFKKNVKTEVPQKKSSDSDFLNTDLVVKQKNESINEDKTALLVKKIRNSEEKLVCPKVDLMTGQITYPILEEIGEHESSVDFLENLTSSSTAILEKSVYEQLVVCPQHPNSFDVNARLYCPGCNSMDIEKLHLFEHKICGYIAEKKNFEVSVWGVISKCPSCKKEIKDNKKEFRIPAMWYTCQSCKEKFDDVKIKLHCRKFNHDFETNMGQTISIPCYKLKHAKFNSDFDLSLISNFRDLLTQHGFNSEENFSKKGKSGHYHNIDLFASHSDNSTIFTFIFKSGKEIDESEINAKIIQVLDCTPTKTIIIGSLSDEAKSIASKYNISVIDSQKVEDSSSSFSQILSDDLKKTKKLEEEQRKAVKLEEEQRKAVKLEEERRKAEKLEEEQRKAAKLEEERRKAEKLEEEQRKAAKLEEERRKAEKLEEERRQAAKLEEERRKAEKLKEELRKAEKLEEELRKAEKLEEERRKAAKLEEERRKAEKLEEDRREAEKREEILKKLEETKKQLKNLKSSFGESKAEEM